MRTFKRNATAEKPPQCEFLDSVRRLKDEKYNYYERIYEKGNNKVLVVLSKEKKKKEEKTKQT